MTNEHYSFESVVPHSGAMVLLDTITEHTETSLTAQVEITEHSMFAEGKGVPSWVGIEYMAQAIAAFAGYHARLKNESVKIGFLVGTRRYETKYPSFTFGSTLSINVTEVLRTDNGMGVFECKIYSEDHAILAKANLNVFRPDDSEDFLQGQCL